MSKILEGFWDCPICHTKGISGLNRDCVNCGAARGNNTKFYLKSDSRTLTEDEVAKVGDSPDWSCSYCNNLNSDKMTHCISCGSSKDESNKNYFDLQNINKENPSTDKNTTSSSQYKVPLLPILGIISIVAVFVLALICAITPKEDTLTVNELAWVRNIQIEELQTFNESGWSRPNGARLTSSGTELYTYRDVLSHYNTKTRQVEKKVITGYKDVPAGTKDMGNGTFKQLTRSEPIYATTYETETYQEPVYRKEPVYKTKYYYEIDRWVKTREVYTSAKDHVPYWGEVILSKIEREGKREESYLIKADNKKDETDIYDIGYEIWLKVEEGDTLSVKVGPFKSIEVLSINDNQTELNTD